LRNIPAVSGCQLLDTFSHLARHFAPDARNLVLRNLRAAERMREMIDTLLDFTQARFIGKLPVSPAPADLGQISGGVADEMRLAWPDRPIEVDVLGDPHGEWDPARLSQSISNLVGNAVAYGDPQTPVHVLVDGTGDDVFLKVSNHGPPIPPDVIPVLFEPFRRGVAEDPSPRGLGLGLYGTELCGRFNRDRAVVRLHDLLK